VADWFRVCLSGWPGRKDAKRLVETTVDIAVDTTVETPAEARRETEEVAMSVMGKIAVKRRAERGTRACMRLREQAIVPGNIYGHKQETVPVQMTAADLLQQLKEGHRVLDVDLDGQHETAIIREVQWDTFGKHLMHVDLLRVDPNEKLTVEVKVELKGTAPGAMGGGILDHEMRTVLIECLAIQIPDSIPVKIGSLEVGQSIHVRELEMPPNCRCLSHADDVVVQVLAKGAQPVLPATEGPAQPELIKKPAKEGAEEAAETKKK
jgi:large subunit ribosomal protein L25